jgi:hypothetical protein
MLALVRFLYLTTQSKLRLRNAKKSGDESCPEMSVNIISLEKNFFFVQFNVKRPTKFQYEYFGISATNLTVDNLAGNMADRSKHTRTLQE